MDSEAGGREIARFKWMIVWNDLHSSSKFLLTQPLNQNNSSTDGNMNCIFNLHSLPRVRVKWWFKQCLMSFFTMMVMLRMNYSHCFPAEGSVVVAPISHHLWLKQTLGRLFKKCAAVSLREGNFMRKQHQWMVRNILLWLLLFSTNQEP